jgi:hypothetical protein
MEQQSQPNTYMAIDTDKYFFASYLNLARHNLFITINDYRKKVGKKEIKNDDEIITALDVLNSNAKPEQALKFITHLEKRLPFALPMMESFMSQKYKNDKALSQEKALPLDYHEFFCLVFKTLNQLRNEFTHPFHDQTIISPTLEWAMDNTLDAAVRRIKQRFGWEQPIVEHLCRLTQGFVTETDKRGRTISKRKGVQKPDYHYKFTHNQHFNEKGLAFFTCLFLEKKEAYELLKKIYGFRDSREPMHQATFEAFSDWSIRMPLVRLESQEIENALALDMLNELQRCPKDLYDVLGEEHQEKFRIDLIVNEETAETDSLDPEVVLRRKDDRFPYHILSYFDQTKAFPKFRFYVDLGNYYYKIYEKNIDKENKIRRLGKKVTAFGRLNEFTASKKTATWKALEKNTADMEEDSLEPYIVETNPHYHFNDDNIGIKISTNETAYPEVKKEVEPKTEKPDFWLSKNELMSMAFYHLLRTTKNDGKSVEDILMNHRDSIRKLFKKGEVTPLFDTKIPKFKGIIEPQAKSNEDPELIKTYLERKEKVSTFLKDNFNIDFHDIPDTISDYLMGIDSLKFEDVATEKIHRMIERTDKMLASLTRKLDKTERKNKIGRKEFKEVKAGNLGDFLATDFLLFQPTTDTENDVKKDGKGKITGLAFQVLQAKLAFYGRDRHTLPDTLKEFNLIDSVNPHPFLAEVLKHENKGIISFYKSYLQVRKQFLEKCLTEKKFRTYHWLRLNKNLEKEKAGYYKRLTQNYLELPVYVPRGIFIEPLKELLLKHGNENLQNTLRNAERANTIFMLQQYFKHEFQDASQGFYEFKRTYKIFNQFNDDRDRKVKLPQKEFSAAEFQAQMPAIKHWIAQKDVTESANCKRDLRDFQQSEKYIRHLKAQDMVLFWATKDVLTKTGGSELLANNINQMKLRDIVPNASQSPLSVQVPFEVEIHQKIVFQNALKIKNYGDFRRFLKDRRLPDLMPYLTDKRIEREQLEKELVMYQKVRIQVFKLVRAFEETALEEIEGLRTQIMNYRNGHTNAQGNIPHEHNQILMAYFAHVGEADQTDAVVKLRNAFAHNEYPEFSIYGQQVSVKAIAWRNQQYIATQFLSIAEATYGKYTEILKTPKP